MKGLKKCPKCGGEPERVATWYADGKTATQRRSFAVQYAAKMSQEKLDRKRSRRGTD